MYLEYKHQAKKGNSRSEMIMFIPTHLRWHAADDPNVLYFIHNRALGKTFGVTPTATVDFDLWKIKALREWRDCFLARLFQEK